MKNDFKNRIISNSLLENQVSSCFFDFRHNENKTTGYKIQSSLVNCVLLQITVAISILCLVLGIFGKGQIIVVNIEMYNTFENLNKK